MSAPSFIIRNANGIQSRAVSVFNHKGFEISISSIPFHPEIIVFKGDRNVNEAIFGSASPVSATAENVAEAVRQIDLHLEIFGK